MNCDPNCDTVQIIEPNDDLLVDTAGYKSDMDERGEVVLNPGQTTVIVDFVVPKLSRDYHFEYLYIDALGQNNAGACQIIPTFRSINGFHLLLAGTPIQGGYILYWRVTVVKVSTPSLVDAPENIYVRLPHQTFFIVPFENPRSRTDYGFTELRVENLVDPHTTQAIIRVQVYQKTKVDFSIAVNPIPRAGAGGVINYFLKARTP